MPVVIEVELLGGRYHAHVWGEAQFAMAGPEWPPSPWRLLRALASAWFGMRPAPSTPVDRDELIESLGRSPAPEMWLPTTTFREVRYYQPLERKRALHHDFFAVPAGSQFYFVFEALLSEKQHQLLDILLKRVQYLGRAESRATLRVCGDLTGPPPGFFRVLPRVRATGPDWIPRAVLCPSVDRSFRAGDLWISREPAVGRKARKAKPSVDVIGAPVHLVDSLLKHRKPLPDGTAWIEYAQPVGSIVHEIPPARPIASSAPSPLHVNSIDFRLCRRVPIPLADVVPVARAYREAAVRAFERANSGVHSRELTGREDDGSVSRGHRHVYYLPHPGPGGLEVARLVVKVPTGVSLTQAEVDALMAVERIHLRWDDRYPITIIPEQTNALKLPASRCWRSLTPFLAPRRHRLAAVGNSPEEQLAASIQESCGITPVRIDPIRRPGGTEVRTLVRAHEYASSSAPLRPGDAATWKLTSRIAHWFAVEFDTPVTLDTSFGADAHFGLGQFAAVQGTGK